jgi:hypothetical protein
MPHCIENAFDYARARGQRRKGSKRSIALVTDRLGWLFPSTLSSVGRWLRTKGPGVALLVGSLVLTAILARMSSSTQPPSTLESWLLACAAAALQIAAGFSFGRVGRADPSHARSSVRQLQVLGGTAAEARELAEDAFDEAKENDSYRVVLGQLSVHLSSIEDHATLAVEDWRDFHADVIEDLLKEKNKQVEP